MNTMNQAFVSESVIHFENFEIAFQDKTDKELKLSYRLFQFINNPILIKWGSPFIRLALQLRLPVEGIVRATIYKHFCGGERIESCFPVIKKLLDSKISTILDYSIEGKDSEHDFEETKQYILSVIQAAKKRSDLSIFAVFKPSGMARMALLEKMNDMKGRASLSEEEKAEYERVVNRFDAICKSAYEHDIPVYIDAEETWIQAAIDTLVTEMMVKYNQEKPIVFNTVQMYRTHRIEAMQDALTHAKANGYFLGIKLVRGAYMEKERERAQKFGYVSPIQASKEATDQDFDSILRFCVENIDRISLCAGTHNEKSAETLVKVMRDYGISASDCRVWFSQLYGMSDHISYNLAAAGYNVSKYLPFGPVKGVLPYLIRRAEENTSIAGQMGREMSMLVKEIKRRKSIGKA